MNSIGRVDFENNHIIESIDPIYLTVVGEVDLIIDDTMHIFSKYPESTIWVSPSFIDKDQNSKIRIIPTILANGIKFKLMPTTKIGEGSVYLVSNSSSYKFNLKFDER